MSSPTWPASLPQVPLVRGLSAQMRDGRLAFEPERGPAITRRGFSGPLKAFSVAFSLTQAQRATFEAFLEDDLAGGSLAFGMRDPNTLDIHLWQIVPGDSLFQERRVAAGRVEVSMTLLRKGQPWYAPYSLSDRVSAPLFLADFARGIYATQGERVAMADALVANAGSLKVSGGLLDLDGSDQIQTLGLDLPASGTVVIRARLDDLSTNKTVFAGVDGAERILFYSSSANLFRSADGAQQISLSPPSLGVMFTCAAAWDTNAGTRLLALDGSTGSETFSGLYGSISNPGLGAESDGDNPMTGKIESIYVMAEAYSEATLATVTGV